MALQKLRFEATREHEGVRLDQALFEWLPLRLNEPISKGKVRKLIIAGAIYLNGSRVRIASKGLRTGARVEAWIDREKLFQSDATQSDAPWVMTQQSVLFEDEDLIAVNKPPGLPTQPTLDEARDNLFAAVKKYLRARDGQADHYLALHHRLDRDTSGVVLLVKSKRANAGIARAFSDHLAQKIYFAIASPAQSSPVSWKVKNYLGKIGSPGKRARFGEVRSGGDYAETDFRIVESWPHQKTGTDAMWVEAMPKTGRTHQIRVHLASGGTPILGDEFYGQKSLLVSRMMLHAAHLTFPHPITNLNCSISSPLPEDFAQCLRRFRGQP